MNTCNTCKFFSPLSKGQAANLCKRYPPVMMAWTGLLHAQTTWPEVIEHYWCGEHTEREGQGDGE